MRNCSARRLTANAGSSVTNTYSYNRRRLLTAETMTPDTLLPARTLGYGYDRQGQVVVETYPDAATVRHTRNALGQVTAITTRLDGGAEQPTVSAARYYPNGALAQFTYGNGIVHTMTQNARQLPARSTDGAVLDLGLAYDGNGNVVAITDGAPGGRRTRSLGYDGLDRLVTATSPMFGAAAYAYDAQDNLMRVQVTGGRQPRDHYYCYNARNQLEFVRSGPDCNGSPAVVALGYDAQGNLAFKNGSTYGFDDGNRLRSAAGQGYRYDALGRRVRSDVGGAQRRYSLYAQDGRLLWQRDEVAGTRSVNVYLAGSLVAEYRRPLSGANASVGFLHTDPLGSPIAKTDATGAVVETSEYEPYGLLLNRANDDRPGYTGHVMDGATGLTYMQQRYYDPQIGRFLSVDPVTAYSNPVGAFNRYRYGADNPYRFIDPDGRQEKTTGCDAVCWENGRRIAQERISQAKRDAAKARHGQLRPTQEAADGFLSVIFGTGFNKMKKSQHPTKISDGQAHLGTMILGVAGSTAAAPYAGALGASAAPAMPEAVAALAPGPEVIYTACVTIACAGAAREESMAARADKLSDLTQRAEQQAEIAEMYEQGLRNVTEWFKSIFEAAE